MMTSQDRDFVVGVASRYMDDVSAVLLGGSQVIENGQLRVASSDHDVIVFGPHIQTPTSVSARDEATGKKYDLILRDPETFAWDIDHEALSSGVGTLLHIAATGEFVGAHNGPFTQVKKVAEAYYERGPYPVAAQSLTQKTDQLLLELAMVPYLAGPAAKLAAYLCLAHNVGVAASRARRIWVGKGKILARFLHDKMPAFKEGLKAAFEQAENDKGSALKGLIKEVAVMQPLPYDMDMPEVPYSVPAPRGYPVDKLTAFYHCRRSIGQCYSFINSKLRPYDEVAQHWMQRKHKIVAGAVDPARKGRESNEYFFALARMTEFFLLETACQQRQNPAKMDLVEQADLASRVHRSLGQDLEEALAGKPEAFLKTAQKTLASIVPIDPAVMMRSPRTHRLKDTKIFG